MDPQPIQLFNLDEENKITLNPQVLQILNDDNFKNKKVCVISIAGAFRQGKSFLLNFFLRYLNNLNNGKNWLHKNHKPISGFSWTRGSERETTGILMWSKIFLTKSPNDEEIAIILLDTQGTFDHETTMTQCTSLFALSVLLSSIQIYNLKSNIDMTHLTHLQLFSEYGKMISDKNTSNSSKKPFQKLLFLIRDWSHPFEYNYGFEGGQKKLVTIIQKHHNSKQAELISANQSIMQNFDDVGCFLLPHPGTIVNKKKFHGDIEELDDEFLKYIKILVEELLKPQNLVIKNFNNEKITVEGLSKLIQAFSENFTDGLQLTVTDMHKGVCESFYSMIITELLTEYLQMMSDCNSKEASENVRTEILEKFKKKKKLGDKEMEEKHQQRLFQKIDEIYCDNFKATFEPNFKQKFVSVVKKISKNLSSLLLTLGVTALGGIFTKTVLTEVLTINKKYLKKMASKSFEYILTQILEKMFPSDDEENKLKKAIEKPKKLKKKAVKKRLLSKPSGSKTEDFEDEEDECDEIKISNKKKIVIKNTTWVNSWITLIVLFVAVGVALWWAIKVTMQI